MAQFHYISLAKPVIKKEGISQGGAPQDTQQRTGMHKLLSGNDNEQGETIKLTQVCSLGHNYSFLVLPGNDILSPNPGETA